MRRAVSHTAEQLEGRVLLSLTAAQEQQFRYAWNHMGPYAKQDLAVAEYENAGFAAKLDADVAALGLAPIVPQAPDSMALADGKSRHHHPRKPHHPKPPKIIRPRHGHGSFAHRDDPGYAGPTVASASYAIATLPQQISFTFSEDVSITGGNSWQTAFELLNLNTGSTIPITAASYDSPSQTVTFSFSPGSAPPDGNYVAILHGSQIVDASGAVLLGSDSIAGDDYVWGSPTTTLPNGLYFFDGDVNGNRAVDGADFSVLLAHYNKPANYSGGDLDYNGLVNLADLGVMSRDMEPPSPISPLPASRFGNSTPTPACS